MLRVRGAFRQEGQGRETDGGKTAGTTASASARRKRKRARRLPSGPLRPTSGRPAAACRPHAAALRPPFWLPFGRAPAARRAKCGSPEQDNLRAIQPRSNPETGGHSRRYTGPPPTDRVPLSFRPRNEQPARSRSRNPSSGTGPARLAPHQPRASAPIRKNTSPGNVSYHGCKAARSAAISGNSLSPASPSSSIRVATAASAGPGRFLAGIRQTPGHNPHRPGKHHEPLDRSKQNVRASARSGERLFPASPTGGRCVPVRK